MLDQLGQAMEAPPVAVVEGAPPVHPLNRDGLLRVTEINPVEFEDGPRAFFSRDIDGLQFGDAGGSAAVFPFLGALPVRQALLAVQTALAMLDRAERRTNGFREFNTIAPVSGAIRRNEAGIARREFRRLRSVPRPWGFLASIVWGIARAIVPGPFVLFEPGDPVGEQDTSRRRTRFYQAWWRLVKNRLAIAGVATAELTIARTRRGVVLRPERPIVRRVPPARFRPGTRLGQLVEVVEVAPSVRGRRAFRRGFRPVVEISVAEFESGPVAVGSRTLAVLDPADARWPWTAYPWIAALPVSQALAAAETALAFVSPVRRRDAAGPLARARLSLRAARAFAPRVRRAERAVAALTSKAQDAPARRELAGFRRRFYDAAADVVAGVAEHAAPSVAGIERERVTAARTAFYQRWWALVKRRLAFADVARAEVTIRRTPRGAIVGPRPPVVRRIPPRLFGQLAGGLDADVELLGRCFAGRAMPT